MDIRDQANFGDGLADIYLTISLIFLQSQLEGFPIFILIRPQTSSYSSDDAFTRFTFRFSPISVITIAPIMAILNVILVTELVTRMARLIASL